MAEPPRVDPLAAVAAAMARASRGDAVLEGGPFLAQVSLRAGPDARSALEAALGGALPAVGRTASGPLGETLGLGPDEWLIVAADGEGARIEAALRSALGSAAGAIVDLSAARVALVLRGAGAREVLATCVALDFHPTRFEPGQCAQTLVAKAPVLIQQLDDSPSYRILVRPSLVGYVVDWLTDGLAGTKPPG